MPYPSDSINSNGTLATELSLLNETPPIIKAQYEIWYSLWPRAKFFAQSVTVPGLENKTSSIYHSGFEVRMVTNTVFSEYSLEMDILGDAAGWNYTWWRNATVVYGLDEYKGKPIVDGRRNDGTRAMEGAGYMIIKLFNTPDDLQHIWRIHNFKVTKVGDVDMANDSLSLLTFSVSGIFTHITYTNNPVDPVALGTGTPEIVEHEAPGAALASDSEGFSEIPSIPPQTSAQAPVTTATLMGNPTSEFS